MARTLLALTNAWQLVSTKICTITLQEYRKGTILINETEDDITALRVNGEAGVQIAQTEAKNTYVRLRDGVPLGSKIVIDEV